MKYFEYKNISAYIGMELIILIIIFSFLGVFINIQIKESLEEIVLESLKKDTKIVTKEVNSHLIRYGELVGQMTTNKTITNYIKDVDLKKITDNRDYEEVKATLKRIKNTNSNISLVWIGIKGVNRIITTDDTWIQDYDYNMQERPWYREMIRNGDKIVYTQPYTDLVTGKMTISIIAPIYENRNLIGNVGIDVHIEQIRDFLKSYSIGMEGYPILITDKGIIVYPTNVTGLDLKRLLELQEVNGKSDEKISVGKNGVKEYAEGNERYYLSYDSIDSNGWLAGILISEAETRSPLNLLNTMSIIIFCASAIVFIFAAIMIKINNNYKGLSKLYEKLSGKEKELKAANEEMSAAYQQLSASQAQLRIQYQEIHNYTDELENMKQKYDIAIKGTNSAVWEYDIKNKRFYLSAYFKDTLGIALNGDESQDEILSTLFFTKQDQELVKNELIQCINRKKEAIYCQVQVKDKNNNKQWMLIHGKGIFDENHDMKCINGIVHDITKLKDQEKYIEHIAYYDPLTNLPNRMKFMENLQVEIDSNHSGAIILLDLDNFKKINDTLGHSYGDKVLQKVAELLLNIKDERVFVSKFGGDEFLILIKEEKDAGQIESYAIKIVEAFKNNIVIEDDEINISVSMGITLYPSDSNDVSKLIMNADVAMYKAKSFVNSKYVFFNQKMRDKLKEKIHIEKILRAAIKEDGFKLLYQPQVCTFTGEIVGFEALIRLKNHQISPLQFIAVAEETGLIIEIGRWVTKEVINQLQRWKAKGIALKPIAINFSAKQLNDAHYVEFLGDYLKIQDVASKYITIEITESIFLDNKEETIAFLNRLKELGVKIALDDFGTGYSSLSYLTFLPVDKIKLDKSLSDKFLVMDNIRIMDSIISLAHSLNLEVIAEGIEQVIQYKGLLKVGCDCIQGYLFSKPLEIEAIDKIYFDNLIKSIEENF